MSRAKMIPAEQALVPSPAPPPTPTAVTLPEYCRLHALAALFPTTMALVLYGWHALLVVGLVITAAVAAAAVWRRIEPRGDMLRWPQILWLALLLSLMFPVHLLSPRFSDLAHSSAVLLSAGVLLVILLWLLGGAGFSRVHPVLLTYLFLVPIYHASLSPHLILHRQRALLGDVTRTEPIAAPTDADTPEKPWIYQRETPSHDAVYVEKVATAYLSEYTRGHRTPQRAWISLHSLLRDFMPPMEDLAVGGHPGPIGASSAIAVIIGGLFLLYRGIIDYHTPLLIVLAAFLAFLILPVPVVIGEQGAQWLPLIVPRSLDWPTVITFANYEILASPLLFMAFFLAPSPGLAPTSRRARWFYAAMTGLLAAACQLYVSAAIGPYVALLVTGLLAQWLDRRPPESRPL